MKTVFITLVVDIEDENIVETITQWLVNLPVEETKKIPLLSGLIADTPPTTETIVDLVSDALYEKEKQNEVYA